MGLGKILNYLSFVLLAILAVPTIAILISWNALPGEKIYPVKRYLEKIALVSAKTSFKTEAALRSKLVERRFYETSTLLNRSSTLGLPELTAEIQSAKEEVIQQAKKEKDKRIVKQEARQLIVQLQKYDQKLEDTKQALTTPVDPQDLPLSKTSPPPSGPPSIYFVQPKQSMPQAQQNIATQINKTQQQVRQTVEELEQITQETPRGEEKNEDREKDKEKEDKGKD